MYYMGLDIETDDPLLKDRGKQKAQGPSWIFGEGRVICTGLYNGRETKAFEGNGGEFVKKLFLRDDVTIVGANIQYDVGWLLSSLKIDAFDIKCHFIDIAIVESLIDEYQEFSLDALALKYLKEHKQKSVLEDICLSLNLKGDFRQHLGKLWDEGYSREIMDYVKSDADQPLRIWNLQKEIVERDNLWEGLEMNMSMIPVVVSMQQKGVRIDVPKWKENCEKAREAYDRLKEEFETKYGKVNINSPKQLAELLDRFNVPYKMRITVKGFQPDDRKFTNDDRFQGDVLTEQKKRLKEVYSGMTIEKGKLVLYLPKIYAQRACSEMLDKGYCAICNPVVGKPMFAEFASSYPIVSDLVQYKQVKNIVDKFLGPVFGRFIAPDGRLHGTFNIVGARRTGRLSCTKMNLQQIPSKTKLFEKTDHEVDLAHMCREVFVPEVGEAFVKLDYSGQENRVVAHFASGKNGDFVQGEYAKNPYFDEHDYVAKVSGLEEAHGKKVGRKFAKNLRFGVCLSSDSVYSTAYGALKGWMLPHTEMPLFDLKGNIQDYKSHLFYADGLEFELSNGVKFASTYEHLFLDCESVDWKTKKASDMKIGDRLPIARPAEVVKHYMPVEDGFDFDEGLAYLAGLYVGDGSITGSVSLITHKVNTQEVLSILKEHKVGCSVWTEHAVIDRVCVHRELKKFFQSFGVGADAKTVPDFVFMSSTKVQLNFLAGLLDSDGCITKYSQRLMGCNEQLMRKVAKLCAILGMSCKWSVCHHREVEKKDEYVLDIHYSPYKIPATYRTGSWQENSDYLGWSIPAKQLEQFRTPGMYKTNIQLYDYLRGKRGLYSHNSWLPDGVWQKQYLPVEIVKITPVESKEFVYLETETGYYIADGFATHNCYGMQRAGMMKNFGWTKEFCDDLYEKVAGAAPWLFEVMEQVQEVVLHRRYIKTLAGRHIHLRKGRDKDAYKYMNYLIQGSAADMTKKATIAINKSRKNETMILTVHDEDCFSVPMTEEGVERIVELQHRMEHSSDLRVPAVCNPEIGPNWADGIEWSPEYGDVREFIREVFRALKNGTFYKLKEKLGSYNGEESFSEFCENLDEEDEDDE